MRKVTNEIGDGKKKKVSAFHLQKRDDFISTMTCIFSIGRCFGIPTHGGFFAVSWALTLLLLLTTIVVTAIWKVIKLLGGLAIYSTGSRSLVARLSGTLFYTNGLLSLVLSWKFVASWPRMCFFWARADAAPGIYFPADTKIRRRTILVAVFVASCAFVEHILSMLSAIGFSCRLTECFENYILNSHGFILKPEDYRLELAIPIFVMSKLATALWNFQDLMIILISMGLTSRYHRLNSFAEQLVKTHNSEKLRYPDMYTEVITWRRLREAYVRQAALVRLIDSHLGALILLSNFNNFYFICLQLFQGINKEGGPPIQRVYYFLSLSWLIFRACSVVLAAADVNVHSQTALPYLYSCPRRVYNVEIKRLENQLTYDNVALKGMGFFSLKRQMLLEVAAAIIKYELVLIQYDKS